MGHGKPKKLRLSPVQRDILWMLDEAGSEDLQTVLITLQGQLLDRTPAELLSVVDSAVRELGDIGLVSLAQAHQTAHGQWVEIPVGRAAEGLSIAEFISWSQHDNAWILNQAKTGEHLMQLILTEDGHKAVRS